MPMLLSFRVICVVLLALLVHAVTPATPRVRAEAASVASTDLDARGLFERGSERYARGEYAEAKQLFEAAYHLSKRPQLLYNVALADDHLRNEAAALVSYRAYLDALPEAHNVEEVRARIRVIERGLQKQRPAPIVADPEEAARTVLAPNAERAPLPASPSKPLVRQWWVWTAVAVVLAGSAVSVAVAKREPGSAGALPGDNGLVVHALVQP